MKLYCSCCEKNIAPVGDMCGLCAICRSSVNKNAREPFPVIPVAIAVIIVFMLAAAVGITRAENSVCPDCGFSFAEKDA